MVDRDPPKAKQPTDYTGLKIAAILTPVLVLFIYLGKADMGLTVSIVLGAIILAIKIRWNLRKHVWFCATIVLILALHVPLFFIVRWPQGNVPTLAYTLPLGIADFLIILGLFDSQKNSSQKTHSPSKGATSRIRWRAARSVHKIGIYEPMSVFQEEAVNDVPEARPSVS